MEVFHIQGVPPYSTNTFLLVGADNHAVIIDPAASVQRYQAVLERENATLTHLLLTHGHHDHVGSVQELRDTTGAKLYMHEADAKHFSMQADVHYVDGETITVDDMKFQVIHTPGHTPGSTCLLCADLLFSGDTLFAGDIGRCDLPGGDYPQMLKSLRKLCDAVTIDAQVLPGHEEFSDMDAEKASNRYLAIANGEV